VRINHCLLGKKLIVPKYFVTAKQEAGGKEYQKYRT
jgi:hypothetical protein